MGAKKQVKEQPREPTTLIGQLRRLDLMLEALQARARQEVDGWEGAGARAQLSAELTAASIEDAHLQQLSKLRSRVQKIRVLVGG